MVRSVSVVKIRGDPTVPVVLTCVPAGTITGASTTSTSQNVRSVRAAVAGNGSKPIMLSMCV